MKTSLQQSPDPKDEVLKEEGIKFMGTSRRQKVLITLITIAFLILAWQSYHAFFNSNALTPHIISDYSQRQPNTVRKKARKKRVSQQLNNNRSHKNNNGNNRQKGLLTADQIFEEDLNNGLPQFSVKIDDDLISLIREYKLTQLQRKIAEEKAEVELARLKAAKASATVALMSGGSEVKRTLNDFDDEDVAEEKKEHHVLYVGKTAWR